MKFWVQLFLMCFCIVAIGLQIENFPYPSPLIKPLLSPKKRWPEAQIRQWVQEKDIDPEFLAFFQRDPVRSPPLGHNIISPADGLLKPIEYLNKTAYLVIALSFWDVHFARAPYDGEVIEIQDQGDVYMDKEGKDLNFLKEKNCPVQKIVVLKTDLGEMKIRLITSFAARRIELFVHQGQKIKKGDKLGHILLGSTVVLELPDSFKILPLMGQHIVGGETILVDL